MSSRGATEGFEDIKSVAAFKCHFLYVGGEGERWIEPYAQYFGGFIQGQGKIFELDLGVGWKLLVSWCK